MEFVKAIKWKFMLNSQTLTYMYSWSFQTDDREIGFEVYLGEKEEVVVPYQKFESLTLQTSSIVCQKPGKCEFISSLVKSKALITEILRVTI